MQPTIDEARLLLTGVHGKRRAQVFQLSNEFYESIAT